MPDRELSEQLRQRLSAALESGAPLASPLPSQAEYSIAAAELAEPSRRIRSFAALAIAAAVVLALVGLQQPREWIVRSVNNISHEVGVPAGSASPSPSSQTGVVVHESPEATESPEANETPGGVESPEPSESPVQQQPHPSPSAEPSDGGGDDHSGGGDGDHSPSPLPSPSD